MVMICCHYPFSSIFLSWDILFAGHQEVHPGLDDMFLRLVFALTCTDSPEKVSEVVSASKWVSQYLCQWPLPAGQALVDLFQNINTDCSKFGKVYMLDTDAYLLHGHCHKLKQQSACTNTKFVVHKIA